ncbi:MAG: translocation/assembly module TamB [Chitinophagaceae bacterium]|jgi:hypothetical protein|nr:translocation/assembly module TamB [Chitinophagaceae bacterium]
MPFLWLIALSLTLVIWKPKIARRIVVAVVGVALLIWLLIQTEPVQNYLVKRVTTYLSKELKTEVSIRHVSFSLFNSVNMNGTLIRDHQKDTLLYAGTLKVRLTDWFFAKKNIELKYIGLEDAVIKEQRKDSVWNFQFLADYFSSPTPRKSKSAINLFLKKIDFKNVTYLKNDLWLGERMKVKMGSMLLDADSVNLNNLHFKINLIQLDKPEFAIEDFEGLRKHAPAAKKTKNKELYFNEAGLVIKADSIQITNGKFSTVNSSESGQPLPFFDGKHISISNINADFKMASFEKDTIKAAMLLACKERSGIEIKKLKANFKLTPQIMEFSKFELHTNNSEISDYYAMKFKDFTKDLSDFEEKITLDGRFKKSFVASDDIAFFAPELRTWKKRFSFSGNFSGKINDFHTKDFVVEESNKMYVSGNIAMKGLPNIDTALMDFQNLQIKTGYADILPIVPALKNIKSPDLNALGAISFAGSFTGRISDFITNGKFNTSIGNITANMNMRFPKKDAPSYKGAITATQFDLGKFLNTPTLGLIDFDGSIDGSSFDVYSAKANVKGHFARLDVNNYPYSNVTIDAAIQKSNFTGDLKISDPNISLTSAVNIDLKDNQPKFNILGDMVQARLQKLNLVSQDYTVTGFFDLNFQGKNIDDYVGAAKILNVTLAHGEEKLSFDSLAVRATEDTLNQKKLSIESNEFSLVVTGKYSILDLPNSFQAFLHKYFPSLIQPPRNIPKDQNFSVSFLTREFDDYAHIVDSNFNGLDSILVEGAINTQDTGTLYLHTEIPYARYKNYKIENAVIEGNGNYDRLKIKGEIEKFFIGDSTWFPNTKINIQSENDISSIHLNTSANRTLNEAMLAANLRLYPDGVAIEFQPSYFVLNDKQWNLEKAGEVVMRKDTVYAQNVKFTQGFQEIAVKTGNETRASDLEVSFKNMSLGDILPLLVPEPRMEGVANGTVHMRNFFGDFTAHADIDVQQFLLNNDYVGAVALHSNYNYTEKKIHYTIDSKNKEYIFGITGTYNLNDSIGSPLAAKMHFQQIKIGILNQFLSDLFTDIKGKANGDLEITGDFISPELIGNLHISNASMLVNFTQVPYFIDTANITFSDDVMDLGTITFRDEQNNTGTASGKIYQKRFKNFRFDLSATTNKLLLINTTAKDNQQFYGRAIGKGTFSLTGPETNSSMRITGVSVDSSHIFIPLSNTQSVDNSIMIFKQYGRDEAGTVKKQERLQMTIDLDLTATEKTQIDVILDPLEGDVIKATGNGRIQIRVLPNGNMTMKGKYFIDHGKYDFNFQSLVKKPFTLLGGDDNYIEWTGDPYDGTIHMNASYTANNVSVNELLSKSAVLTTNSGAQGYRGDVYVIAHLRGKLTRPDISFSIDFPEGSSAKSDPEFTSFLSRMASDKNEMIKQVTYLVVFGSFAPYEQVSTANTGATAFSGLVNSISQAITGEMSRLLSDVLYRLTGDKSLKLDLGYSMYSTSDLTMYNTSTTGRADRQNVNLKINKSIMNDKVIFSFGTDLDINTGAVQQVGGNFQWLPDLSIQVILSKNRKLRGIIFNRSSLDASTGSIGRKNRMGTSLTYTKDFEKLFGKKSKKAKPKTNEPAATTAQ